jgi:hypothetical protein
MQHHNKIVHGLWIGPALSALELLCLKSFTAMGHEFHLWLYEPLRQALPAGVTQRPAASILPAAAVFRYQHGNQFGHGKGSLAGFSDLFRYQLLYQEGGWWADMDVTCLKPLDFQQPYVFRSHDALPAVGNLMKCPPGSALMKACFEEAQAKVNAESRDWLAPIRILNKHIGQQGLTGYIVDITNQDRWEAVAHYAQYRQAFPEKWHAFHWMNEEWRSRGLDKDAAFADSALGLLLQHYDLTAHHLPQAEGRRPAYYFRFFLSWLKMAIYPRIPRPARLAGKQLMALFPKLPLLAEPIASQMRRSALEK